MIRRNALPAQLAGRFFFIYSALIQKTDHGFEIRSLPWSASIIYRRAYGIYLLSRRSLL